MSILSIEIKNQQLVTEKLQQGYELLETKAGKKGLMYLLGKENGSNINVLVVKEGAVSFNKDWKKSSLNSLQMITDMTNKQVNG